MKPILIYVLLTLASIHSKAQQITNTAGGNGNIGPFFFDWNFGELTLVNTLQFGNIALTQGMLQGEIRVQDANNTGNSITDNEIKILPNPTSGSLNILAGFLKPGTISFILFDASGKQLQKRTEIYAGFTTYNFILTNYANGLYPMHIIWEPTGEVRKVKSYKILKN